MKKDKKNLLSMAVIVAFLAIAVASSKSKDDKAATSSSSNPSDAKDNDKKVEDNWKYSENADKMTGEKSYLARATSTNKLDFKFPYDGGSTCYLTIRNEKNENDIALRVSKGQFMTSIGESESLRIKFDEEKPMSVAFNSATDGSMDVIFIEDEKAIISKLKSAKKVTIEAPFFQEGRQMIDFNIAGLKWER